MTTHVGVLSISEQKPGLFDPLDFARGYEKEMLLLESADIITKLGEKSMLLLDLALKIQAHDNRIDIHVLMPEAKIFIDILAQAFKNNILDQSDLSLSLNIDPLYNELDMLAKMKAKSALDILRVLLKAFKPDNKQYLESLMLSGVFAYDFLDHFEKLPKAKQDILKLPDYLFYVPLSVVIIDHKKHSTHINAHALLNNSKEHAQELLDKRLKALTQELNSAIKSYKKPEPISSLSTLDPESYKTDMPDDVFGDLVELCKEHIRAGDVYQIVPSRTFTRELKNIFKSYETLRSLNPSPYMFYVRTSAWTLFGASPETFIKVDKKGTRVSIRPIAGTRRRGLNQAGIIDEELDAREQASLCLDEKELAEHMMLVDLARNDIASIAQANSRRIRRLLGVDRFSHVMHLVSEVEGILRTGFDALSAYQASMNMGTLMGAPKVRAAELLRNLENSKRGFYGGAVGYITALGDMDTAIIIRSALVKDEQAYVRAGCGVVYDSDRDFEVRETINKAEAVLKAMELASL